MNESIENQGLADVLARLGDLDREIKEAGVTKANIRQLRSLLAEYDELEAALVAKRQKQFWDTAYEFCVTHKIAGGKTNAALSAFLRQFAAHVVRSAGQHLDLTIRDVYEVVDHIPEMDMSEAEAEHQ